MINYIMRGHEFTNETQTAIQIFFPNKKYTRVEVPTNEGITIETLLIRTSFMVMLYENGSTVVVRSFNKEKQTSEEFNRSLVKMGIYKTLRDATGIRPPWGNLTGIRPARIITKEVLKGSTYNEARDYLINEYDATREKADLALEVSKNEEPILKTIDRNSIDIYIGIPFCPTRCLYCSFASYPIEDNRKRVSSYIDALIKEIEYIGEYARGLKIRALYIGGGTPTSISTEELRRVLSAIDKNLEITNATEYTVEAGRPDTITKDKLLLLKEFNVKRLSINPQSMNEETLELIGRGHSPRDIEEAFRLARSLGFDNINMDTIVGLPKEDEDMVKNTFEKLFELSPESLTVHTLAVKRASRLKEEIASYSLTNFYDTEKMLKIAGEYARKMGMEPYYLYRQKNSVGNFENVGYAKKGRASLYNVDIMEEEVTILGAGAGSTTKVVNYDTGHIFRIFNVKSLEDYINRIDEMIARKQDRLPKRS